MKTGEFDWESINMIGFNTKRIPIPQGADARIPMIANKLYLGITPKNYPEY